MEGHSLCDPCYDDIAGRKCDSHGPGYVICGPKIQAHEHAVKKRRTCDRCGCRTDDDNLILHQDGVPCWEGDELR